MDRIIVRGSKATRSDGERGFSIVLVIFSILIVTTVGLSTLYVASRDSLAADSREQAALARLAAETGMRHLMSNFQPTLWDNQIVPQGGEGGAPGGGEFDYVDVLEIAPAIGPVTLPSPPGFSAQYVAWGGAPILGGTQVIVEGRILSGNNVVARSRISGFITMSSGNDRYGQYGATSGNTGHEGFEGPAPSYGGL